MSDRFDIAVVGAGSAGFSAAITAAGEGARVALIGYGTIGGTCVNVGCVPSKTMIRLAQALHDARSAGRFAGIHGDAQVDDWAQVIAAKDDLVDTLRQKKYIDLLPEYPRVSYLDGPAQLTPSGVRLNGSEIETERVIVATGSSPAVAAIPGLDSVPTLNSTTALELAHLPRSMLVLGAGYVGCELAQLFARVGVEVTLVTRSRLLPGAEEEIAGALQGYLQTEGMHVYTRLAYQGIETGHGGVALHIEQYGQRKTLHAEQVLVTTGRTPNTQGLALADNGIKCGNSGGIEVDDRLRTSKAGVYAAGDVTGRDQFVYMAACGAKLAALNALNGDTHVYDNRTMPWVVFTDPQLAGVGLTETAAKAAGHHTKVSVLPLEQLPRALAARDTRGLIKLVADADSDRLLGAQVLAPEGADSIQTAALAIQHKMTAQALGETIFPYLTTVEGLKLAAQSFGKDVRKLSCCAG